MLSVVDAGIRVGSCGCIVVVVCLLLMLALLLIMVLLSVVYMVSLAMLLAMVMLGWCMSLSYVSAGGGCCGGDGVYVVGVDVVPAVLWCC